MQLRACAPWWQKTTMIIQWRHETINQKRGVSEKPYE